MNRFNKGMLAAMVASAMLLTACKPGAGEAAASAPSAAPSAASQAAAKPALTVTLTQLQDARWPLQVPANGLIAAWQEAVVGAEVAGLRITAVKVNVGDVVRRGQVLAEFNRETVAADLASTKANLAEAQAMLVEAQANAERARQVQREGVMTAQQVQNWLTGEQTARARVESLQARLVVDDLRLAQTRLVAPDDGVISARVATVGSVVQPGQEMFRLIRQGRLEWRAEVAQADAPRIKAGQAATLALADGSSAQGKVRVAAPTVNPATGNATVFVDLSAPGVAKAGMFATGRIDIGSAAVRVLPQAAVQQREGFNYVFVLGAGDRLQQTKVTVGPRQGDAIAITGGLAANARVVASGAGFLTDGDIVRVVASAQR